MKISEHIAELNDILEIYGDIDSFQSSAGEQPFDIESVEYDPDVQGAVTMGEE